MKSRIYHCNVIHSRLSPVKHSFAYPLYVYAFDLSELPQLDERVPFFGYNRLRPVSVFDKDYLSQGAESIGEKLKQFLHQHNITDKIAKTVLVTSARFFNYVFNPVSFYYCYKDDGSLRCTVAEVNNTFRERHLYILDQPTIGQSNNNALFSTDKQFHVSPFNDMKGRYDFDFSELGDLMDIRLRLVKENATTFQARIWGKAVPFNTMHLTRTVFQYSVIPWLTMPRILWQAAILYFGRKMNVYSKPNPTHVMTIRTAPASLRDRVYSSLVKHYLLKIQHGCLQLTMPDRSVLLFGDTQSELKVNMKINSYQFFHRVVKSGSTGFGEAYTAGDWETDDLPGVLMFFLRNQQALKNFVLQSAWAGRAANRVYHALRRNTRKNSKDNIQAHYDLSNDFFGLFLDPTMTYSSAMYQSDRDTLEQAQINKLNAIIKKADIQPTDHVLEIGSGWGSFSIQAVKQTGCRITTITLSEEQHKLATQRVKDAGLEKCIQVKLCDYRDLEGQYDTIVSIEMIEAVGHEFLGTYFSTLDRLLKPGGRAVIQAISVIDQNYESYRREPDWIQKHIFPGGVAPSLQTINDMATSHSNFHIDHVENIGLDYAKTLREWRSSFLSKKNQVLSMGFDESFIRKWDYYFAYCEAGFDARILNTYQIVFNRPQFI